MLSIKPEDIQESVTYAIEEVDLGTQSPLAVKWRARSAPAMVGFLEVTDYVSTNGSKEFIWCSH